MKAGTRREAKTASGDGRWGSTLSGNPQRRRRGGARKHTHCPYQYLKLDLVVVVGAVAPLALPQETEAGKHLRERLAPVCADQP